MMMSAILRFKFSITRLECWILAVLSVLYYVLNMCFPYNDSLEIQLAGRIYPQIAGALVSAYCIFLSIINYRLILKNRYMILFAVLGILALLYVFYPFQIIDNLKYVLRVYFGIFYMLALYVLLLRCRKTALWIIYLIFAFQVLFGLFNLVFDRVVFMTGLSEISQFDSHSGFIILSCIPLSLTIPQKRLRLYTYFLLVIACFYTGQRSAALCALISFPFCIAYLKPCIKKIDIALICILLLAAIPLFTEALRNIMERNAYDIDKGEDIGSGRMIFWKMTWDSYLSHDFLHILLGNGTNSIAPVLERKYGLAIGAHNGWLDILYTFGIPGFLIYLQIVVGMFVRNRLHSSKHSRYRNMYLILFILFVVKCSTSHGFFDINVAPFCAIIAIMESEFIKRRMLISDLHRGSLKKSIFIKQCQK